VSGNKTDITEDVTDCVNCLSDFSYDLHSWQDAIDINIYMFDRL
jgi:hypothetical protein